ncbi:immunoglobulin superfamily member 5 [Chelmon rostratus]|uniref:immunoglobulin superfamily member 5 n=1 Tax=Chelmon rostratus TaxID=109905 RepID=UPI001BE8283F|nr:immunoglobulin superfamily member 5 [Chelmon rostratus]
MLLLPVVSQQFHLQPQQLTVLQGSEVRFNATVEGAWQLMTWTVGGLLVLTVSSNNTVTAPTGQFTARYCSAGDPSCVEFTIHNATRRQSGSVICAVLGPYGSRTAQLSVQESGTVSILGGNVTVVQGQQVEFQCVTFAWCPDSTLTWTLNGEAVNSSLYNTTSRGDGDCSNSTSVLNVHAVSTTRVECLATMSTLTSPESSSVFLVVVPKPPDWTVLISVVVSFGGAALLVLLITGIVFCYKRRKEKKPSYQNEMSRRVRTQSEISGVNAAGKKEGQENAGYVPDGKTSAAPSEVTDSGFFQANGSHIFQMPDFVNSSQAENTSTSPFNTVDDLGFRKHRHVTIV